MFSTHFNPKNSFLISLQISLLFMYPCLKILVFSRQVLIQPWRFPLLTCITKYTVHACMCVCTYVCNSRSAITRRCSWRTWNVTLRVWYLDGLLTVIELIWLEKKWKLAKVALRRFWVNRASTKWRNARKPALASWIRFQTKNLRLPHTSQFFVGFKSG